MDKVSETQYKECDRCNCLTDRVYNHKGTNDYGEEFNMNLCHRCDHDVINGGDIMEDSFDVNIQHEEDEYLEDPINNPRPSWMR